MTSSEAPALTLDSASPSNIRLHVTPFDADLSKVILSSSILPHARNISYHSIETFPEKRYGFVDLPREDADKLRKKLNGAVLKGVKIRIEPARASSIPEPLGQEAVMGGDKSSKRKESRESGDKAKQKKRKRDNDEIAGVVLEEGRKVKRGWTTTDEPSRDKDRKKKDKKEKKDKKDKKDRKQAKSKYTDHEECLVKTILPANVASSATAQDDGAKKRKKKGTQREVVVHEFEKTTKFPTFLRDSATSSGPAPDSLEYVEGKGWVDGQGNVVQPVKPKREETYKIKTSEKSKKTEEPPMEEAERDSGSDLDGSSDESDKDDAAVEQVTEASPGEQSSREPETSVTSPSKSLQPPEATSAPISPGTGSAKSLTIKIPPATPNKVHPLEALYKKPKQGDEATSQETKGFSFFGNVDNDDIEDETAAPGSSQVVPLTPYTREDIELRGIRSAAPTPDTAHPGRKFKPWVHEDDDIEEEAAEEDEGGEDEEIPAHVANGATGQAPGTGIDESTSDFQKWFWENRGDLNRSWRKRRKLAGKEKRYRENKARLARAI
ncbi:hypothetical protein V8F20_004841 [Naviculisporaceae sp. PSN 640]